MLAAATLITMQQASAQVRPKGAATGDAHVIRRLNFAEIIMAPQRAVERANGAARLLRIQSRGDQAAQIINVITLIDGISLLAARILSHCRPRCRSLSAGGSVPPTVSSRSTSAQSSGAPTFCFPGRIDVRQRLRPLATPARTDRRSPRRSGRAWRDRTACTSVKPSSPPPASQNRSA